MPEARSAERARPRALARRAVKRCALTVAAVALASVAFEKTAAAQLHWDAAVEAALDKRFLTNRAGPSDAGFGPAFRLSSHLALLPLIRMGFYAGYAMSPQSDIPETSASGTSVSVLRHMVSGGAEARIFPPFGFTKLKPFLLVGFGYQRTFAGSANGGCLETPLGLGASYRVRKPFEIGALLTSRIGFACHGDLYRATSITGTQGPTVTGQDRFGLSLGIFGALEL